MRFRRKATTPPRIIKSTHLLRMSQCYQLREREAISERINGPGRAKRIAPGDGKRRRRAAERNINRVPQTTDVAKE
jgi:hypothetical protein